ncbi:hypothetical protein F511_15830 [Dorcoceras hygrometricum]|uniref:Uncharacterized protein n=1 Tax=Dorcoceras hygrometricum TaxID=472368 RepID=A0A2Z7D164_9LAMI|nr:hypothetical protein F511_15830 [Dorcoceras hygrometricum]
MSFSDLDVVSGMTCPSERAVLGSSDEQKSGSAGLLLWRRFVLYLFRRLGLSWKKIAKEDFSCSLLAFEQIFFYRSEPVSPSQLGGRHSNPVVTTPMIALDFSGTTHQSASHNVAFNQISPGTANLKPSLTGHGNSAFCTVFVQNSLFNGLSITDIRSFVSSIVFERTTLRDVQRSSVSVASQNVRLAFSSVVEDEDNQMDIDKRLASPTTTADSSMNFIDNEIHLGDSATSNQPSLPTVAKNLLTYLDDFRTLLWQRLDAQSEDIRHIGDSHNDVLLE